MATNTVTGATKTEVQEKKESFEGTEDEWQQKYCLSKIPRQPDEYDGPPRYCQNTDTHKIGSAYRCEFHGGARPDDYSDIENIDPLAHMKHGMKATRENVRKDFSDKDTALYNWIVEHFPDAYEIDIEADPMAAYDLHRLAVEIVRAERGRGFLIEEGEVREDPVKDDDGRVVVDDNGEIVTEKSSHYLHDMLYDQDNKITKLERELGISRKEQNRQDSSDEAVEELTKGLTELGGAFLQRDDKEYDPEDEPWEQENDGD